MRSAGRRRSSWSDAFENCESVTTRVEWRAIQRMYSRISGASARDGGYRNGIVSWTVVTSTGASDHPGRR